MLWNSIRSPVSSSQVRRRSPMGRIGVRDSHSNSTSILRRERLSTMATSYPCAERCSEVGQPQKPSPPSTNTFILRAPFLLYATSILSLRVRPNRARQPAIVTEKRRNEYKISVNVPLHVLRGLASEHGSDGSADDILTQINF